MFVKFLVCGWASVWLGLSLLTACKSIPKASSELESVVYSGRKWTDTAAIPVCVVNSEEVDPLLISDLASHVGQDYGLRAGIYFQGWKPCQQADYQRVMIRVYFQRVHNWNVSGSATAGGGLSAIGPNSLGCEECAGGTMLLKIGSEGRYPGTQGKFFDFIREQTRGTAVHEFGHALGLLHEHERSDGPGCQDFARSELPSQVRGVQFIGAYDPDSIMNYCHRPELSTLSSGDIAGLGFLYPEAAARVAGAGLDSKQSSSVPKVSEPSANQKAQESPCRPSVEHTVLMSRTIYSGAEILVSFRNACQDPLELIWLDEKGEMRSYGLIAPGAAKNMRTYEGHAWQFWNKSTGKLLRELRMAAWMQDLKVP